jgi:hypothetical protein
MGIIADRLQAIQSELVGIQMGYRDTQIEFWALALAWEAVRCAWYICTQKSFEKLGNVNNAYLFLIREHTIQAKR